LEGSRRKAVDQRGDDPRCRKVPRVCRVGRNVASRRPRHCSSRPSGSHWTCERALLTVVPSTWSGGTFVSSLRCRPGQEDHGRRLDQHAGRGQALYFGHGSSDRMLLLEDRGVRWSVTSGGNLTDSCDLLRKALTWDGAKIPELGQRTGKTEEWQLMCWRIRFGAQCWNRCGRCESALGML
jgi:hypothetical protein